MVFSVLHVRGRRVNLSEKPANVGFGKAGRGAGGAHKLQLSRLPVLIEFTRAELVEHRGHPPIRNGFRRRLPAAMPRRAPM